MDEEIVLTGKDMAKWHEDLRKLCQRDPSYIQNDSVLAGARAVMATGKVTESEINEIVDESEAIPDDHKEVVKSDLVDMLRKVAGGLESEKKSGKNRR